MKTPARLVVRPSPSPFSWLFMLRYGINYVYLTPAAILLPVHPTKHSSPPAPSRISYLLISTIFKILRITFLQQKKLSFRPYGNQHTSLQLVNFRLMMDYNYRIVKNLMSFLKATPPATRPFWIDLS